jgi:hypothetical protein
MGDIELNEREQVIFKLLKQHKVLRAEDILKELKKEGLQLNAKRATHSLAGMMKYLTAKACQDGWIISMIEGGRGTGNKAIYHIQKRF